jgi:hypothetical protein
MAGFTEGLVRLIGIIPRVEFCVKQVVDLKVGVGVTAGAAFPVVALKNVKPFFLPEGTP